MDGRSVRQCRTFRSGDFRRDAGAVRRQRGCGGAADHGRRAEAGRAVSKKDFFEEEHKNPVEDKVKIEKEVVKNEKPEEPKQNEKVENDMPDKTQEIFRQVNEYLQQERNNLNDTKKDN